MLSFTRLRSGPSMVTLTASDTTVLRQFGRPGALKATEHIECDSAEAAQRTRHRIAQRLMRKGYVAGAHHPGLIDAIAADPDDPAGYAVYADWLAARNDPRAALIEATHTPKYSNEIKSLLDANPYHFLHDLWRNVRVVWWMGFIRGVEYLSNWSVQRRDLTHAQWRITNPGVERMLALIRSHPSGRFLRDFRGSNGIMDAQWRAGDGPWTACYRRFRGHLDFDLRARPVLVEVRARLEPVALNTAPLGMLVQLPAIGRRRAEAVIARRRALGGFKSMAQLASIPYLTAIGLDSLHTHCTLNSTSMKTCAAAARTAAPSPPG